MAIQQGIISLSGKVGDLVFSNRKGKRVAKKKSMVPMNQTEATKKSSSDFGVASKVGARMRKAFAPFIKTYSDTTLVSRFTKHVLKVFKTIPIDFRGQKKLAQGNIGIFQDFQFNTWARLDSLLFHQPKIVLGTSSLTIEFKEVKKTTGIGLFKQVAKADFVFIKLMVYNLSLENDEDEVVMIKELGLPAYFDGFKGAKVEVPLNFKGQQVVFVAIGIHYEGKKIHTQRSLSMIGDRTKKAASIMEVVRLSDGEELIFAPEPKEATPAANDEEGLDWNML
jgi:hypothetical protein